MEYTDPAFCASIVISDDEEDIKPVASESGNLQQFTSTSEPYIPAARQNIYVDDQAYDVSKFHVKSEPNFTLQNLPAMATHSFQQSNGLVNNNLISSTGAMPVTLPQCPVQQQLPNTAGNQGITGPNPAELWNMFNQWCDTQGVSTNFAPSSQARGTPNNSQPMQHVSSVDQAMGQNEQCGVTYGISTNLTATSEENGAAINQSTRLEHSTVQTRIQNKKYGVTPVSTCAKHAITKGDGTVVNDDDLIMIYNDSDDARGNAQEINPYSNVLPCATKDIDTSQTVVPLDSRLGDLGPSSIQARPISAFGHSTYKCSICVTEYKSSKGLSRHLKAHEPFCRMTGGRKRYSCEICQTYYQYYGNYYRHKKEAHSAPSTRPVSKDHNCPKCHLTVRGEYCFTNHLRTHDEIHPVTGERKKYKCSKCKTFYANSGQYNKHKRKFHRVLGNSPTINSCFHCKIQFKSFKALELHTEHHKEIDRNSGKPKPYKCTVCCLYYNNFVNYKLHITKHHAGSHEVQTTNVPNVTIVAVSQEIGKSINQSIQQVASTLSNEQCGVVHGISTNFSTTSQENGVAINQPIQLEHSTGFSRVLNEQRDETPQQATLFTGAMDTKREDMGITNDVIMIDDSDENSCNLGKFSTYTLPPATEIPKSPGPQQRSSLQLSRIRPLSHKCPKCPLKLSCEYHLNGHLRTHDEFVPATGKKKKYNCSTCKTFYANNGDYYRHMQKFHRPPRTPIKVTATNRCSHCRIKFESSKALAAHAENHKEIDRNSGRPKPYKCTVCCLYYNNFVNYKMHVLKHHTGGSQVQPLTMSTGRETSPSINVSPSRKSYNLRCEVCGINFSRPSALKTHSRIHCQVDKKTGLLKRYRCIPCNAYFAAANSFYCHKKIHRIKDSASHMNILNETSTPKIMKKTKECNICNVSMGMVSNTHKYIHDPINRETLERKEFKCVFCPSFFNKVEHLESHISANHSFKEKTGDSENTTCRSSSIFPSTTNDDTSYSAPQNVDQRNNDEQLLFVVAEIVEID